MSDRAGKGEQVRCSLSRTLAGARACSVVRCAACGRRVRLTRAGLIPAHAVPGSRGIARSSRQCRAGVAMPELAHGPAGVLGFRVRVVDGRATLVRQDAADRRTPCIVCDRVDCAAKGACDLVGAALGRAWPGAEPSPAPAANASQRAADEPPRPGFCGVPGCDCNGDGVPGSALNACTARFRSAGNTKAVTEADHCSEEHGKGVTEKMNSIGNKQPAVGVVPKVGHLAHPAGAAGNNGGTRAQKTTGAGAVPLGDTVPPLLGAIPGDLRRAAATLGGLLAVGGPAGLGRLAVAWSGEGGDAERVRRATSYLASSACALERAADLVSLALDGLSRPNVAPLLTCEGCRGAGFALGRLVVTNATGGVLHPPCSACGGSGSRPRRAVIVNSLSRASMLADVIELRGSLARLRHDAGDTWWNLETGEPADDSAGRVMLPWRLPDEERRALLVLSRGPDWRPELRAFDLHALLSELLRQMGAAERATRDTERPPCGDGEGCCDAELHTERPAAPDAPACGEDGCTEHGIAVEPGAFCDNCDSQGRETCGANAFAPSGKRTCRVCRGTKVRPPSAGVGGSGDGS